MLTVINQIKDYITSLPEPKRSDMVILHENILRVFPKDSMLWFLDGKDATGKIVTNPNIGYGYLKIHYANGATKDFYQTGISANSTGISVYIMGLEDKKFLVETYKDTLGKATITGYCIKFKKLQDIDLEVLKKAILEGIKQTS